MQTIYMIFLLLFTAILSSLVTTYLSALKRGFKRLLTRKGPSMAQRVDLLEKRVKLHENKDSVYLGKFDELEKVIQDIINQTNTSLQLQDNNTKELVEQINNLSTVLANREKNTKSKIRTEVNNYLSELKND